MAMIFKDNLIFDKVAYDFNEGEYNFKATYLLEPKGNSLIQISKDGKPVREFLFPSYKIYNISAHASGIVEDLKKDSDEAIYHAGSTGFGNVFGG